MIDLEKLIGMYTYVGVPLDDTTTLVMEAKRSIVDLTFDKAPRSAYIRRFKIKALSDNDEVLRRLVSNKECSVADGLSLLSREEFDIHHLYFFNLKQDNGHRDYPFKVTTALQVNVLKPDVIKNAYDDGGDLVYSYETYTYNDPKHHIVTLYKPVSDKYVMVGDQKAGEYMCQAPVPVPVLIKDLDINVPSHVNILR